MSRRSDYKEIEGNKSMELSENICLDKREQVVVVEVEKEPKEEEDSGEDSHYEEEKRQLLVVENNAPQPPLPTLPSALGVQVISVTCQSRFPGKEKAAATTTVTTTSSSSSPILPEKGTGHCHQKQQAYFDDGRFHDHGYSVMERKSNFRNAFLTLILALFNLFWSVGLTYWHFHLNNFTVAVASLVIMALSGAITSIAFFAEKNKSCSSSSSSSMQNKSSLSTPATTVGEGGFCAKKELWKFSKVAWLLAAVPCLVPVLLAGTYFILNALEEETHWSSSNSATNNGGDGSSSRDSGASTINATNPASGGNEGRQCAKSNATTPSSSAARWLTASGSFFVVESLSLCFPLFVLHLSILMENPNSIPSVIGLYTLLGLFILSFSITFSRFQFDCLHKPDRFGDGVEMYLRFTYLWSAKLIWLVTFPILIVTMRLLYPGREIEATVAAVAGLTAVHEIPLWLCLLPRCSQIAAKLSGLFFLIPQFTSLISLIYWVNADPHIYDTNIGSVVLGLYFWSETLMLCGWLIDGNADKDVDLVPFYPHFFGDLISASVSN